MPFKHEINRTGKIVLGYDGTQITPGAFMTPAPYWVDEFVPESEPAVAGKEPVTVSKKKVAR